MNRSLRLITISMLCMILFCQCQDDSGQIVRMGIEDYSSEEQKKIGQHLHEYIQNKNTDHIILARNQNFTPAYDFIEKIFQQAVLTDVVTNIDFFDWTIHILVDDQTKNAFTLPGGHLYIYTGLLRFIESDAELFAVITREIALADLGSVGVFLGDEHGPSIMGDIFLNLVDEQDLQVIESLEQKPYNPEAIFEADQFSIDLACLNYNFDDRAILNLINRSFNKEVEWFATHPSYPDRSDNILNLTSECLSSSSNQNAYKSAVIMHLP